MPFFDKRPDIARDAEQTLHRADREVREVYGPPGQLTTSIVNGAHDVWSELADVFQYPTDGSPSEPQMYLLFELIYFFAHMTLRLAVASQYSKRQIGTLQAFMGPLLASTVVDTFFAHWPEEWKKGLRGNFFDKLNDAEQEYATCRKLVSEQDPLSPDTLFGRVARNSCALWERDQDIDALTAVLSVATRAFAGMHLEAQVAEVKAVIDRVDPKRLASFWKSQGA